MRGRIHQERLLNQSYSTPVANCQKMNIRSKNIYRGLSTIYGPSTTLYSDFQMHYSGYYRSRGLLPLLGLTTLTHTNNTLLENIEEEHEEDFEVDAIPQSERFEYAKIDSRIVEETNGLISCLKFWKN